MNLYLEGLSQDLKKHNKEAVVIMDGAGWHKSKDLKIPDNITIELLPPYCPELNPVERLWQYIKGKIIKNKVFNSLTELENAVCVFVKELSREKVISICNQERS
jgi:transposase